MMFYTSLAHRLVNFMNMSSSYFVLSTRSNSFQSNRISLLEASLWLFPPKEHEHLTHYISLLHISSDLRHVTVSDVFLPKKLYHEVWCIDVWTFCVGPWEDLESQKSQRVEFPFRRFFRANRLGPLFLMVFGPTFYKHH